MASLSTLLIGLTLLASADEPSGVNPCGPASVATILASPERYGEMEVHVRGLVLSKTRAVFPNGRAYYTLAVGDGQRVITVFSWTDPAVKEGDHVEVTGVFHIWRYNLHHVIESRRIARLKSSMPAMPERPVKAARRLPVR